MDSSVGIATVRGSDAGGCYIFRARPDSPLGRPQFPVPWLPGFFLAAKAAGAWR